MAPRPDVSEERRMQIIESAVKVFAREGLSNARMDDVAAESGLSKGLLYWYFKSKDEIVVAIADMLFSGEFRRMEKITVEGRTARACLEEVNQIYIDDLNSMLKVAPVVYEFYAMAFRNKVVRRFMQTYLRRYLHIVEPIIRRGMERGEFAEGDARRAAITIGSALEGTMLLWAFAPNLIQPEEQLRTAMRLIVDGLERK